MLKFSEGTSDWIHAAPSFSTSSPLEAFASLTYWWPEVRQCLLRCPLSLKALWQSMHWNALFSEWVVAMWILMFLVDLPHSVQTDSALWTDLKWCWRVILLVHDLSHLGQAYTSSLRVWWRSWCLLHVLRELKVLPHSSLRIKIWKKSHYEFIIVEN